ncbi:MAG TPA: TonB family protein, partial [Pyrinomonadaceae bacterium]|nr:TonB family protein [Pyrinomonadaceae bacterium]
GKPVTIKVPVAQPDGVREEDTSFRRMEVVTALNRPPAVTFGSGGGRTADAKTTVARASARKVTFGVSQGDLVDQSRTPTHIKPDARTAKNDKFELRQPVATTEGDRKFPTRYGDPNSKVGGLSNGTGSGGGQGSGYGRGQGSSYGTGAGSGTGTGSSVPPARAVAKVTIPLKIISKPQAKYTEESRTNNIQGSVRLKVTLLASGQVGSITPVTRLPHGLTEQAIAAARLLRFEPAKINGVPISKTITIDYSFLPNGMNSTNTEVPEELLVSPDYPKEAGGVLGDVEVDIETDTEGNVVNAKALSGPEEFLETCVRAARLSKFAPTLQNGGHVRMKGILVYKFVSKDETEVSVKEMKIAAPTADEKRIAHLQDVMHFWLYATYARLETKNSQPTPNEAKFVSDGKANVRLEMTEAEATMRDKLRETGLEIDSIKGSIVRGRISLDKLASLAEIAQVKYVAPSF